MVAAFYIFVVISVLLSIIWKILPYILAIPVILLGAIFKFILLVIKNIIGSIPWLISAILALTFVFYGFGRKFFFGDDLKILIAEKLPPRVNIQCRSLSLLTIELMMVIRENIAALEG